MAPASEPRVSRAIDGGPRWRRAPRAPRSQRPSRRHPHLATPTGPYHFL